MVKVIVTCPLYAKNSYFLPEPQGLFGLKSITCYIRGLEPGPDFAISAELDLVCVIGEPVRIKIFKICTP